MTDEHPARRAPLTEERARKLLCAECAAGVRSIPILGGREAHRECGEDRLLRVCAAVPYAVAAMLALDAAAFERGRDSEAEEMESDLCHAAEVCGLAKGEALFDGIVRLRRERDEARAVAATPRRRDNDPT